MKAKFIFVSTFLLTCTFGFAQSSGFGLSFSSGVSGFFSKNDGFGANWKLSGNAGFYLRKQVGGKSAIGIELLYAAIESKNTFTTEQYLIDPMNSNRIHVGYDQDIVKTSLGYLAIPVKYIRNFKKAKIGIGVQTMFLLHSKYELASNSISKFSVIQTEKGTHEFNRANKIDFGPTIGLEFRLTKHLGIGFQIYRSIRIISEENAYFDRRIKQATIGVNYSLNQKKNKSEQ